MHFLHRRRTNPNPNLLCFHLHHKVCSPHRNLPEYPSPAPLYRMLGERLPPLLLFPSQYWNNWCFAYTHRPEHCIHWCCNWRCLFHVQSFPHKKFHPPEGQHISAHCYPPLQYNFLFHPTAHWWSMQSYFVLHQKP